MSCMAKCTEDEDGGQTHDCCTAGDRSWSMIEEEHFQGKGREGIENEWLSNECVKLLQATCSLASLIIHYIHDDFFQGLLKQYRSVIQESCVR
jgi:hypothetical protein